MTISELQTSVRISLGFSDIEDCPAIDINCDDRAGVAEIIAAIGGALTNCYGGASVGRIYECPWPDEVDDNIHTFLMAGQSNMRGVGRPEEAPAHLRVGDPRVLEFRNRWTTLRADQQWFGPEIAFAHTMARACPNSIIGVLKHARSATGINAWLRDWNESLAALTEDAERGPLYPDLLDRVVAAQTQADVSWEGFVWVHGQSDKRFLELAEAYGENMALLIDAIRDDLGNDELPFIFNYRFFRGLPDAAEPVLNVIALPIGFRRVEEEKWYARLEIPYAYAATWDGLDTLDIVHLTTEGYLIAGKRLAESYILPEFGDPGPR